MCAIPPSDFSSGEILKLSSLKEQKRTQNYKTEFKVYSDTDAVSSALKWIRANSISVWIITTGQWNQHQL